MKKTLDDYPVIIEVPVRWGDMDAFEHVNNIVYFQYFESARIAYFERIGAMEHLRETGVGPILASTACRYRFPVTYPDTLQVGATVTRMGRDRFTHEYLAISLTHNAIAAEGEGVVVTFDYTRRRTSPIPEPIRQQIGEIENRVVEEEG